MSETNTATWDETANGAAVSCMSKKTYGEWLELRREMKDLAVRHDWSKNEVARRSDIAIGTLSQWFSGTYRGRYDNINARVRQWLVSVSEMADIARALPAGPGFIETRTAREIIETLTYAQMLPEMAVVTLAAGMGKSMTCRHYATTRPHAHLITMSPSTRSVYGMLMEIAGALGLSTKSTSRLHRLIGERLARHPNSLLILDEAQNLSDEAVDQARAFLDQYACGLVLMGNEEIYSRFERKSDGPSYAQIKRRIGKKMRRDNPYAEDITALIDAWQVTDAAAKKFLTGVGRKAGALGQIDKTMRLATIIAKGEGANVDERHIRAAWENRGMEDA